MAKSRTPVPGDIAEEFYQITLPIYTSFSKYRPPVDLFQFEENIASLYPFYKKDSRLSNEQIEKALQLCSEGNLFVSRKDLPIYMEHIVHQLDLVLMDQNFKQSEVAKIIIRALQKKYTEFTQQPVRAVFEALYSDVLVFTEYISKDKYLLRPFLPLLYTGKYDVGYHAVNSLILGMWMFMQTQDKPSRRMIDAVATGLLVHDIGMSKIPAFVLGKSGSLNKDETGKSQLHPTTGVQILQKIGVAEKETLQAVYEHHERFDGTGYPRKLNEGTMGLVGKITAIADSLSAMIQERPHAEAKDIKIALTLLMGSPIKYDHNFLKVLVNAAVSGYFDPPK